MKKKIIIFNAAFYIYRTAPVLQSCGSSRTCKCCQSQKKKYRYQKNYWKRKKETQKIQNGEDQ